MKITHKWEGKLVLCIFITVSAFLVASHAAEPVTSNTVSVASFAICSVAPDENGR